MKTTLAVYIQAFESIDPNGNMQHVKEYKFLCPSVTCALKKAIERVEEERNVTKELTGHDPLNPPRFYRVFRVEESIIPEEK